MNNQITNVVWNPNDQDDTRIREIANVNPQAIIIFRTDTGEICNPHSAIQHFCDTVFTHPVSHGFVEFMVFNS